MKKICLMGVFFLFFFLMSSYSYAKNIINVGIYDNGFDLILCTKAMIKKLFFSKEYILTNWNIML